MIHAEFRRGCSDFIGFKVSGHAGYAPEGEDLVCAAVTSAVQLITNAITEVLKLPAKVCLGEDSVEVSLPKWRADDAVQFIRALHLHLSLLQQEYPQHITVLEV